MKTIILGGGISGLAAGYYTNYPIFEASNKPGGICRSYTKDGFQFSTGGGHWLFENDKTQKAMSFVRSLVDLKSYERKAGIYYNTTFPYPIQTFTQQENISTPGYFKNWLANKFSNAECNIFFNPFNEKYTAGLYDEIVQFDSYKTPPAGSVGFVSKFHDPVNGLGSLIYQMTKKCDIRLNHKITKIDLEKKKIFFQNGDFQVYDNIISTIPLDQALLLCGQRKFELPYSSVFVLNVGGYPDVNWPEEHWLYIPFSKTGFYRIGFYTNIDKNKAPKDRVSLSVEMAVRGVELEDLDVDQMTNDIINELESWRLIKNICTIDPTWVRHAYTWMRTLEERETHIKWLKERDIISIGRYGLWKFQGMMESIEQGLNV